MGYKLDSNIIKAEEDLKNKLSSLGIEIILDDDDKENEKED